MSMPVARKRSYRRPAGDRPPAMRDIEIVFCDLVAPAVIVGYGEDRRSAADWMFDFRANVPANHLRGIAAYTYFARWRITPNLPGRLAAIVALKDRAMRKGIMLLEVFDVRPPQS